MYNYKRIISNNCVSLISAFKNSQVIVYNNFDRNNFPVKYSLILFCITLNVCAKHDIVLANCISHYSHCKRT